MPHSNHPAVAPPAGLIVPCNSAEFDVTAVASFVATDGLVPSEKPATAPNKSTVIRIPKRPACFTVASLAQGLEQIPGQTVTDRNHSKRQGFAIAPIQKNVGHN